MIWCSIKASAFAAEVALTPARCAEGAKIERPSFPEEEQLWSPGNAVFPEETTMQTIPNRTTLEDSDIRSCTGRGVVELFRRSCHDPGP